jgi:alkylhydroperoxidase family enzyme
LDSYLAKVRDHSYRIAGRDFETLSAAGLTEDEIFELTVAAALGAALRSFDAGMRVLNGEG